MISFIVAPPGAEQLSPLKASGILHPLAGEVLNAMRQHGSAPIGLWKLINKMACAQRPDHRARHRCWRLRYAGAIRELCRAKLMFRHRGLIATCDFAYMPKRRRPKLVLSSVDSVNSKMTGSIRTEPVAENSTNSQQPVATYLESGNPAVIDSPAKTQSAVPTPQRVGAAAGLLAMRQRMGKKKWTGILNGERIRRGTPVKLPDGTVQHVFAIQRGKVYVFAPKDSGRFLDRFDESQVERLKNPAAVLLGGLKSGRREKPSVRKQEAARRNGCLPPREGSKPRGRPRKAQETPP